MSATVGLGAALLLPSSLYLGMGFTLVVLMFPGALATTDAASFPQRFGDPVRRAVAFFTVVSLLMVAGGVWLTGLEWDEGSRRLLPLAFVVLVVAATSYTVAFILPVNRALYRDVPDAAAFRSLLQRWIRLNTVRAGIWGLQWVVLAVWLVVVAS